MYEDYENPQWEKAEKIHDWRNYISEDMQIIWDTFTPLQQRLIADNAQETADAEDWD